VQQGLRPSFFASENETGYSTVFFILRLADRAMFQECDRQFLLPEAKITLLFRCGHWFLL